MIRTAHAEALVFLDSCCEVNVMWLQPLLGRQAEGLVFSDHITSADTLTCSFPVEPGEFI